MKRLILHSEVEAEIEDAADFYESRREGYGERFRALVNDALSFIRSQPKASSLYKKGTARRRVIKPFGYGIYYVELDVSIFVLAVMNQRRRPDYWLDRLREIEERVPTRSADPVIGNIAFARIDPNTPPMRRSPCVR